MSFCPIVRKQVPFWKDRSLNVGTDGQTNEVLEVYLNCFLPSFQTLTRNSGLPNHTQHLWKHLDHQLINQGLAVLILTTSAQISSQTVTTQSQSIATYSFFYFYGQVGHGQESKCFCFLPSLVRNITKIRRHSLVTHLFSSFWHTTYKNLQRAFVH